MKKESPLGDESLSAWLDGALESAEADAVQKALRNNPELQRRLGLMVMNERLLHSRLHRMASERPVPQRLAKLLEAPQRPESKWRLPSLRKWLDQATLAPGLAMAAVVVALAVGILAGHQARFGHEVSSSLLPGRVVNIDRSHELYELLESTASGQTVALTGSERGLVAFSYQDREGAWCRQFELQNAESETGIVAVACREENQWQMQLVHRFDFPSTVQDQYQAAGAETLEVLDAYIMQRSTGDVLVGASEAEVLGQGWYVAPRGP